MKVTEQQIHAKIKDEMYMVLPDGRSTLCILTMKNGFTIKGLSACVDPAEFDLNIGRQIAYKNAFDQIWMLEGYLLAERLFSECAVPVATNPPPKEGKAKIIRPPKADPAAWGFKKDGTPKSRPGRKAKVAA